MLSLVTFFFFFNFQNFFNLFINLHVNLQRVFMIFLFFKIYFSFFKIEGRHAIVKAFSIEGNLPSSKYFVK